LNKLGVIMEEETTNELDPGIEAEEEEKTIEQALLDEKAKAEDYLANWQRAQADLINYRRRSEQEKAELGEYTKAMLVLGILPVLDDFERAISAVPEEEVNSGWLEGIRLIERKLRTVLESEGLSPIEALGESFDPNLHEAVRQDKGEEGIVIEEVQKGYKFRDRVLRASRVVIGNGETEED